MAELIEKHQCDVCDNETYHVKLAEPQSVRVEEEQGGYIALAEYANIHLLKAKTAEDGEEREPDQPEFHYETRVFAADHEHNEFTAILYAVNKRRSLDEVIFTIGGEAQ